MTDRFDNLSAEDLAARLREALAEVSLVEGYLNRKLVAACPVKIAKSYRIRPLEGSQHWKGMYPDRHILVANLYVEYGWNHEGDPVVIASGPLKRSSKSKYGYCGGWFTSKHVKVPVDRLDLESMADLPPDRWPGEKHDWESRA